MLECATKTVPSTGEAHFVGIAVLNNQPVKPIRMACHDPEADRAAVVLDVQPKVVGKCSASPARCFPGDHQPIHVNILLQPSCVVAPAFSDYVRSRSSSALAAFRSALSNTTVNLL